MMDDCANTHIERQQAPAHLIASDARPIAAVGFVHIPRRGPRVPVCARAQVQQGGARDAVVRAEGGGSGPGREREEERQNAEEEPPRVKDGYCTVFAEAYMTFKICSVPLPPRIAIAACCSAAAMHWRTRLF